MAVQRDHPYGSFNFLVAFDGAELGGFSEIVLPEISVGVIEYRSGSDPLLSTRKLPGLVKYSNVVLKRGLAGSMSLYQWIDEVRNGGHNAFRTVVISLQNEDRSAVVWTWKLHRAWPVKYSASDLNAKGTDVAIESIELAIDRLEIE